MRIAIDVNPLYTTRAGTARYVTGLLHGFSRLESTPTEIRELGWRVDNLDYRQPARALRTAYRECVWANAVAPLELARERIDLLHMTGGLWIRHGRRVRTVATLLDCAVFRHPERFRSWQRRAAEQNARRFLEADRVICISRFTADEAIALLGADARRLEVVHLGSSFASGDATPETPPPFELPLRFFLFVGSLEPGKNLALLRHAWERAAERHVDLPPLVIVGARREGVATEGTAPASWIYAGEQPDAVVKYCYTHAESLLFPSRYEGFGLPVLEAMSLGCPVICSKVASLPEVAGEAPLYADPTPDAYLDAMTTMLRNDEVRRRCIGEGRRRAASFSWTRCASETERVYAAVASRAAV